MELVLDVLRFLGEHALGPSGAGSEFVPLSQGSTLMFADWLFCCPQGGFTHFTLG